MQARAQGRLQEAVDILLRVVRREPDHADCNNALAAYLNMLGKPEQAVYFGEKSVAKAIGTRKEGQFLGTLATSLSMTGKFERARELFQRALALEPNAPTIWSARGSLALTERDFDTAIACFERATALLPDNPAVRMNLALGLSMTARAPEAAAEIRRALTAIPPNSPMRLDASLMLARALNYVPDVDPALIYQAHVDATALLTAGISPRNTHANPREPDRILRIGYLSGDLRRHSVAYFLEPLLEHRDRERFEVTLYSTRPEEDAVTERLRARAERWRTVVGMPDDALDKMIVDDQIDVLVDLSGLTDGQRQRVLARKPAPVQCTYLGYANTTGSPAIDVRIVDDFTDPPELEDIAPVSEARARLGRTMWAFAPPPDVHVDPVRSPERGASDGVVFGSFNSVGKLHSALASCWAKILARVPGSKLVIKAKGAGGAATQRAMRPSFESEGVSADRVVFIDWADSLEQHLKAYQQVDIGLDTWPFCGTTTTCEAMWMGVPVVTLVGVPHAARVGGSLLRAVSPSLKAAGVEDGLDALITPSIPEYIDAAVGLAHDRARLTALRRELRGAMQNSALMDGVGLARAIEGVYRERWRAWCAGA